MSSQDLEILKQSRELVARFMGLMRAAHLYDPGNDAILHAAGEILELATRIRGDGVDLEVKARHDSIYIGGERIRESAMGSSIYHGFIDVLRRAGLGSFTIDEDAQPSDLEDFSGLLIEALSGEPGSVDIAARLDVRGVRSIGVEKLDDEALLAREVDQEQIAKRVYLRSIGVVKNVFHSMRADGRVNSRLVKRVVQQMIEAVDHGHIQNLSSLKNYDEYTFNHSVNVSVLAIALGRHVGLSRRQLYVLGQAGMLHDLGKLCIPIEVLNKPGKLTPDELKVIQNHPIEGFVSIASKVGVFDDTIDVALGAFQHHINPDGTGYPEVARDSTPGFLSRIVSIADRYDAMTSARVYRKTPIPAWKALSIMYHRQGSQHDNALLRYFMNMLGAIPLGTTVRLSDGSVGIVVAGNPEPGLSHLPTVRLVLDASGQAIGKEVIDLASRAKGADCLTVEEAVDPARYGIEIMDYLL